jgi:hypothetical protein
MTEHTRPRESERPVYTAPLPLPAAAAIERDSREEFPDMKAAATPRHSLERDPRAIRVPKPAPEPPELEETEEDLQKFYERQAPGRPSIADFIVQTAKPKARRKNR